MEETMSWMRCGACEHVFTNGYWDAAAMERIFSTMNESELQNASHGNVDVPRMLASAIIQRVLRWVPEPDSVSWLDVGAGSGFLSMTADEFGIQASCIDARQTAVDAIVKRGYKAECADFLDEAYRPSLVDVVSMLDVVEHMPFPVAALKKARSLLITGGVLFISMPNMDSSSWKVLDERNESPYWPELEHFHNFTRERLYRLLDQVGFRPIAYSVSSRYKAGMEIIATARRLMV